MNKELEINLLKNRCIIKRPYLYKIKFNLSNFSIQKQTIVAMWTTSMCVLLLGLASCCVCKILNNYKFINNFLIT